MLFQANRRQRNHSLRLSGTLPCQEDGWYGCFNKLERQMSEHALSVLVLSHGLHQLPQSNHNKLFFSKLVSEKSACFGFEESIATSFHSECLCKTQVE